MAHTQTNPTRNTRPRASTIDYSFSTLLFCVAVLVFVLSPLRSLGETQYTMMVAQTLIKQRTFALDRHTLQLPDQLNMIPNTDKVRDRPLEVVGGRVYKYAPPGSSLLSLPFVAFASMLNLSPTDDNGFYNADRELKLSAYLAALLMGMFAVVCFLMARVLLPVSSSLAITVAATFGTQVWSTASRVVEPDTWSDLLMILVVYLLIRAELRSETPRPILLASLLSCCYLIQPTASISIVAISIYVLCFQRQYLLRYVLTGGAWFAAFLVYSRHNFGQWLPNYYEPSRLDFLLFRDALAGNLVSPARGVFLFVPTLLFVAYTLVRYWRFTPAKKLVLTSLAVLIGHVLTISGFTHWWAGHSYGPRYWTSVVPWFVLLAVLGIAGMLKAWQTQGTRPSRLSRNAQITVGMILAVLAIFIHARGSIAVETRLWNARPVDIDFSGERIWDWRYPQFLAGLIRPSAPPSGYPLAMVNQPIDWTSGSAETFIWYGWSGPEPGFRWTNEKEAAIVFRLEKLKDTTLAMRVAPFIVSGELGQQRVVIDLNGDQVKTVTMTENAASELTALLPAGLLKKENVIRFILPDASSPKKLGLNEDDRMLGIAVQWIEFRQTAETEVKVRRTTLKAFANSSPGFALKPWDYASHFSPSQP